MARFSEEVFQEVDGEQVDASIHNGILDNPEASAEADRAAINRAVMKGMDATLAEKLYMSKPELVGT